MHLSPTLKALPFVSDIKAIITMRPVTERSGANGLSFAHPTLPCPEEVQWGWGCNLTKNLDSCFEGLKATTIRKPWWQDRGTPSQGTLLFLPPRSREMDLTAQLLAVSAHRRPQPPGQVFLPELTFSGDAIIIMSMPKACLINALGVS